MGIETYRLQPQTLIHGKTYLLIDSKNLTPEQNTAIVEFVGYDPCPAIVIIKASDGVKQRCQRSLLLTTNGQGGRITDAGQMAGSGG